MAGNLDQTSRNKTQKAPVSDGMLYTMLSWAKSHDRLKVLNVFENQIKVSNDAVVEMEWEKDAFLIVLIL